VNIKGKFYLVIMLAAWFLVLSTQEGQAQLLTVTPHDLLPEQKIKVEGEKVPPWKSLWDEARKSALRGDFETALRQYKALLVLKSNLQEARWELARILIYLKQWKEAAEILEPLIESTPDSVKYIDTFGKIMWEMGQYERAVSLFKKAYEINPSDRAALAGLVEGLSKLSRKNEAIPFLEQLNRQEPTNSGVRRYLAFLLYETGNYEKAKTHFTILARNEDVGLDVLTKTAETYGHLGLKQQAAIYWERILGRDPENIKAHEFLGGYYEEIGQSDRALTHLETILAQKPDDIDTYLKLGLNYENTGEYDKALEYYEKILKKHPKDREILQYLTALNKKLAQQRKIQQPVLQPPTVPNQKQIVQLKKTIKNLKENGRYKEIIPVYQQLIKISPENHEILSAVARDLIAAKNRGNQGTMAEFLSEIALDDMAIIRSMAEQLRHMSRKDELISVLNRIHELDPSDNLTTQELAVLYLNRGDLSQSQKYFDELSDSECWNIRCLEARGTLYDKKNLPAHRLKNYEYLLKLQPDRYEIRLRIIGLAAQLGLLDTALFHAGYLQNLASVSNNLELKIMIADAYRVSGYLNRAVERYQNVIDLTAGENKADIDRFRIRSWLGISKAYEKLGLIYEAEQALRQALVTEKPQIPLLVAMFHLYLETGRFEESGIWLKAVNWEVNDQLHKKFPQLNTSWVKEFFQAEMHEAVGDYDLAVDLYKQAEVLLPENFDHTVMFDNPDTPVTGLGLNLRLAVSLLKAGRYEEAENLMLSLKNDQEKNLEQLVLLEQIYLDEGKGAKAGKIHKDAEEYAAKDFGRQLELAKLYGKYGKFTRQGEAAQKAAATEAESLAAQNQFLEAALKQGKYAAALELLDQLLKDYPENILFLSRQAELLAKVGNFQEALIATNMILAENQDRRDIILLRSRLLWELNRWKDSVSLNESILAPPVEEILMQKINELALTLGKTPEKNSWWEMITFSEKSPHDIVQLMMLPKQAAEFSENGQKFNSVTAPYYALYRWQDEFEKELSVRRSVMRREYYHAANKLEKFIEEFGSNDFLLYDLAGLYSKLDRLADEAMIYRRLAKQNESFPGLSDAVQRNDLKRRPQVTVSVDRREDDGWHGYKAVEQDTVEMGWKFYGTNQRWDFDAARIYYESTRGNQKLNSWRTLLTYDLKLSQSLGVLFKGGYEKPGSGYSGTPIWSGAVKGKIADEMLAVFSVKQDVVTDTIASLKRNIKKRDYKAELFFDLFPRLLLGGYFDFAHYSDSNWTNNYRFWASYIVLPEPASLKVSYNYDIYDSIEGNIPGTPSDDGFALSDHPYWSPVNYWITRFSVNFRHQLSDDALARGIPRYYTVEYSFGYDAEDNDLHELKASLNFEIAKNYTISGSYDYLDLGVFQHKEIYLSLMYRF